MSENKGGVQLTINFKSSSAGAEKKGSKRGFKKPEMKELSLKPPKAALNQVAQKLLNQLCDLMNIDKEDSSTALHKLIANHFRTSFISYQSQNLNGQDNLIGILTSLNQLPLLKKLAGSLLQTKD